MYSGLDPVFLLPQAVKNKIKCRAASFFGGNSVTGPSLQEGLKDPPPNCHRRTGHATHFHWPPQAPGASPVCTMCPRVQDNTTLSVYG